MVWNDKVNEKSSLYLGSNFASHRRSFLFNFNFGMIQIVPIKSIKEEFPFHKFFDDAPKPLFKGHSYEEDMEIAEGCFRWVNK